ncbi:PHP domain-containing protein [Gottfriedia acidiceleris]|uniref:PHP domain-containing protein n=1 Tax=Gottfriedia acidiceleris TaxID=371036 RepID=UPI002FFD6AA1
MKIDGHTHTHFCPHGTGELVEKMIEKAIVLGFDEYHITEHPPLPEAFEKNLFPLEAASTITFQESDTDIYIKEMLRIKTKYKDKLNIKIGFEIDYLPMDIPFIYGSDAYGVDDVGRGYEVFQSNMNF